MLYRVIVIGKGCAADDAALIKNPFGEQREYAAGSALFADLVVGHDCITVGMGLVAVLRASHRADFETLAAFYAAVCYLRIQKAFAVGYHGYCSDRALVKACAAAGTIGRQDLMDGVLDHSRYIPLFI